MDPILNLKTLNGFTKHKRGAFCEQYAPVSERIGAQKLGYSVSVVEPGQKACPFHNHHVNEEMFLVLEGEGTLRFGDRIFFLKPHDIIACPPGGKDVAHQIINSGDKPLKYLCLSTQEPVDVCEYPDSGKVMSMVGSADERSFKHISYLENNIDYFDGEK